MSSQLIRHVPFHDEGHGYDVFGLHPPTLARAARAGSPIYDHYFRVDSQGIEHVPAAGPAILVANHGGMLPVDAVVLGLDVLRRSTPPRIARLIADRFVPRLPLIGTLAARLGVVSGTRANVRRLLDRGELIAIWPEGVSGPAKPFRERYRIQDWSVGFAELAVRHRAPVVPIAIVGAEESWPVAVKLPIHAFGSPYVPLPVSLLPLPVHYHIRYGPALRLDLGLLAQHAEDPALVEAAAHRVRRAVEGLLAGLLGERRGVFR
jgi:1-acyl-sn-glycerol-3-phosphate acyltransferase